jgi:hypothetical protein
MKMVSSTGLTEADYRRKVLVPICKYLAIDEEVYDFEMVNFLRDDWHNNMSMYSYINLDRIGWERMKEELGDWILPTEERIEPILGERIIDAICETINMSGNFKAEKIFKGSWMLHLCNYQVVSYEVFEAILNRKEQGLLCC